MSGIEEHFALSGLGLSGDIAPGRCPGLSHSAPLGLRIARNPVPTRFRIWATQRLREYIVKGYLLDDERLKNPDLPFDYFEVLQL